MFNEDILFQTQFVFFYENGKCTLHTVLNQTEIIINNKNMI